MTTQLSHTAELGSSEATQRLLWSAIDNADDGIMITDSQLNAPGPTILFVNEAFCRMTGYSPADVLGKTPRILQGPLTDRAVLSQLRRDLIKQARFEGETVNYRKDGSHFTMHWSVLPAKDAAGNVTHYIAVQRDMTHQRQLEQQLQRAGAERDASGLRAEQLDAQLLEINRLNVVGEMVGTLAHELNQPLTAISNYAHGCANRVRSGQIAPGELEEVLDTIGAVAMRAADIIERLRSYSRRKEAHRRRAQLHSIVDAAKQVLQSELNQARVMLVVERPIQPIPEVFVEINQIEQVFVNLLRNAIESMTDSSRNDRTVTVVAHKLQSPHVEIEIRDGGQGLPFADPVKLFQPFSTTKEHGLGMGLPISRSIIEQHGGRIWAQANPNGGSCFRFTLPTFDPQGA